MSLFNCQSAENGARAAPFCMSEAGKEEGECGYGIVDQADRCSNKSNSDGSGGIYTGQVICYIHPVEKRETEAGKASGIVCIDRRDMV